MKSPLRICVRNPAVASAVAFAVLAASAHAADDALKVTTVNPASGHTDCTKDSFGYPLSERAAVVRGVSHHKLRIERNLVDVGLEGVAVESCSSQCSATITRKGNFDSGSNGNLIDRKGFVEIDFHAPSDAPTGPATLVLKYLGGGRGEYKLLIVRNSRVDRVERSAEGSSLERYILSGNNLHLLRNSFNVHTPGGVGVLLTRVSEADERLVLDRNARNCSNGSGVIDLTIEAATACRIKDVRLPMTRDASCGGGANPPPPPPAPAAPPPAAGGSSGTVRLNLTPQVSTPATFFRSLSPSAADNTAARRQIANGAAFCSGVAIDEERVVNLPVIRWGIGYANLPANGPVSADIINADSGATLQRQTAAAITVGNGSDIRLFDNWTGRPTSVRVVNAQSDSKRRAMGASAIGGNAAPPPPAGCYLAPGEPLGRFDPSRLTFRVNTGTPPLPETISNDNEITL